MAKAYGDNERVPNLPAAVSGCASRMRYLEQNIWSADITPSIRSAEPWMSKDTFAGVESHIHSVTAWLRSEKGHPSHRFRRHLMRKGQPNRSLLILISLALTPSWAAASVWSPL